mmetsp:Transcript_33378/g.65620  ORF Transcript_33378/g.65620 Transcript_33378/m.65620 type:complete len:118 (+) Transcript_33378:35-388(+)
MFRAFGCVSRNLSAQFGKVTSAPSAYFSTRIASNTNILSPTFGSFGPFATRLTAGTPSFAGAATWLSMSKLGAGEVFAPAGCRGMSIIKRRRLKMKKHKRKKKRKLNRFRTKTNTMR